MADPFQPKFVDLVRNSTSTVGTGNFVLGPSPAGYRSFTAALQPGDSFYYSAIAVGNAAQSEVGRGTLQADGTIARQPISGSLTNFAPGLKTVALVASAEWFSAVQAAQGASEPSDGNRGDISVAGGAWTIDPTVLSAFGRTLIDDEDAASARSTLGLGSAAQSSSADFLSSTFLQTGAGASARPAGAKMRESWVSITDFGGVADCTAVGAGTDNTSAFNAAKAALSASGGGTLFIPRGKWRFSQKLVHTEGIQIIGEGFHSNPGKVAGTSYSGINIYDGTVLVFDADVGGMAFYEFSGDSDAADVAADLAANGINSAQWAYKSARTSVVRDLVLYGGGGTGTSANGIDNRTTLMVENVYITNFAGTGLLTQASTSGAGRKYGNASHSRYENVHCRANKLHGFYTRGIDANVITFDTCDSANNGGAGFLEDSFLGNTYLNCHAATNNRSFGTPSGYSAAQRAQVENDTAELADQYTGSFVETPTFAVNAMHTFLGCYTESGTGTKAHLRAPSRIEGGLLTNAGARTATSNAVFISPGTGGGADTNLDKVTPQSGSFTVTHNNGGSALIVNGAGGVARLGLRPGTGAFSNLQLTGNSNSIANGMDILAGGGAGYLSANSIVHRNAAQSTTFNTANATGFNINTGVLQLAGATAIDASLNATLASVAATGNVTTSAGSIGYASGAGGSVVQATSKSAAVTLNKACGRITMHSAALAANTSVGFTLNNSVIGATDVVIVNVNSTPDCYTVTVDSIAAGSCRISLRNVSSGGRSDAVALNFAVVKAVIA